MCRQFESKIAWFRWRGSLISSDDQPGDLGHPQHTLLPPVCFRAADRSGSRDRPHRAVKPISRSQGNDGYRADSGPSGGGPCKGAIRPKATSTVAICYVRFTSIPAGRNAQRAVIPRRLGEQAKSTPSWLSG
jgi:hypothetical protein